LTSQDRILDPFAGAGTTILVAKEKGIPATGYDISPLAVLISQVKLANYDERHLRRSWRALEEKLDPDVWNGAGKDYPVLVKKALPGRLLGGFDTISREIGGIRASDKEKDFFRLALLSILPQFSRAVATGGWLSWVDKRRSVREIPLALKAKVEEMLEDLKEVRFNQLLLWQVKQADARYIPDNDQTYTVVITSPPYPNRHDYTRVFGVELMFGFLDWEQTRELRYQSFHSHPESHPQRPDLYGYVQPLSLSRALSKMRKCDYDPRVPKMLEGYFQDIFLVLKEISRVCRSGTKIAFVIGNAQYRGQVIRTDELTAAIGEQTSLCCERIIAVRYRGNSAQQMAIYGRRPSREAIVAFKKP
jgi:site-specific DNA-methyltransferase (cytosine-N4-specific)